MDYVQCLVCGRVTPVDKGICYHCNAPLPSRLRIPAGMVVCPNCLRITPVDTGYCRRCTAPIPPDLAREALMAATRERIRTRLMGIRLGRPLSPGTTGRIVRPGDSI